MRTFSAGILTSSLLRLGALSVGTLRQSHNKTSTFAGPALYFDAAEMVFDDLFAKGSPRPVPFPLVVKNGRKIFFSVSGEIPRPLSVMATRPTARPAPDSTLCAFFLARLNGVQQQVQQHLLNLPAIVFHGRKRFVLPEFQSISTRSGLFPRKHEGVLNCGTRSTR